MITEKTTVSQLRKTSAFSPFSDYLLIMQLDSDALMADVTVRQLCGNRTRSAVESLNDLAERSTAGLVKSMDVWSEEEVAEDPGKTATNLLFIRGKEGYPYFILCAGGAYISVCSALEAYPAAKPLYEAGYNIFVLTYRVGQSPLLPKPQQDLACAVRLIESQADSLKVMRGCYAVMGFSAGAHLVGSFGTENMGYRHFGLPKPVALILAYPATSAYTFKADNEIGDAYISMMIGTDHTKEKMDAASVECNLSKNCPPVYIIHSRDDDTVPFETSLILKERLVGLGVSCRFRAVEGCAHGFADGFGESEGWIADAAAFFAQQAGFAG